MSVHYAILYPAQTIRNKKDLFLGIPQWLGASGYYINELLLRGVRKVLDF